MHKLLGKKYLYNYIFIFIFSIGIFFRFYNIPARYGLDFDPTRDVLITLYGSQHFLFPQAGPPSGIGPFNFGPWYYYQLIFFTIIFPISYAPWIFIGITSLACIYFIYKIGIVLEGKKLGLVLAALMAFTPAETGQIRALSNPSLIPFYAVLTIWIFLLLVKKRISLWWSFAWGIILGIGINIHFQMLPMMVFPLLLFIFSSYQRWQRIIVFLVGLLLSFLPLLFFNVNNHWQTANGLIFYFTQGKNYIPYRWLFYFRDFLPGFWSYVLGVPQTFGILLAIYTTGMFFYLIIKKKIAKAEILLLVGFILIFISLRYLLVLREYYYLVFTHVIILTLFGISLFHLFKIKYLQFAAVPFLLVVLFFMTQMDKPRIEKGREFTLFKNQVEKLVLLYPNKKFAVYGCVTEEEKNRVQGIVYFLSQKDRLDENGYKIGFFHKDCVISDPNIKNMPFNNMLDLSVVKEASILNAHMKLISPRTVFNALGLWDKM